jgi:hypothetical protein
MYPYMVRMGVRRKRREEREPSKMGPGGMWGFSLH